MYWHFVGVELAPRIIPYSEPRNAYPLRMGKYCLLEGQGREEKSLARS